MNRGIWDSWMCTHCVCVCLRVCACTHALVCTSGRVVSRDKRWAGSTSLQRKENTSSEELVERRPERQQWVWLCWKIHEGEGGQVWRSRSRFGQSLLASPCHDADMWYNATGGSGFCKPLQINYTIKPKLVATKGYNSMGHWDYCKHILYFCSNSS